MRGRGGGLDFIGGDSCMGKGVDNVYKKKRLGLKYGRRERRYKDDPQGPTLNGVKGRT